MRGKKRTLALSTVLLIVSIVTIVIALNIRHERKLVLLDDKITTIRVTLVGLREKENEVRELVPAAPVVPDGSQQVLRIEALESSIIAITKTLDTHFESIWKLDDELRVLTASVDVRLSMLNNRVEEIEVKAKEMRENLLRCEVQLSSLAKIIDEIQAWGEEHEKRITTLEAQNADLQVRVKTLSLELTALGLKHDADIARIDSENRLVHYNYDAVLAAQRRAAVAPKEVEEKTLVLVAPVKEQTKGIQDRRGSFFGWKR